jgi:hypothetical protein
MRAPIYVLVLSAYDSILQASAAAVVAGVEARDGRELDEVGADHAACPVEPQDELAGSRARRASACRSQA